MESHLLLLSPSSLSLLSLFILLSSFIFFFLSPHLSRIHEPPLVFALLGFAVSTFTSRPFRRVPSLYCFGYCGLLRLLCCGAALSRLRCGFLSSQAVSVMPSGRGLRSGGVVPPVRSGSVPSSSSPTLSRIHPSSSSTSEPGPPSSLLPERASESPESSPSAGISSPSTPAPSHEAVRLKLESILSQMGKAVSGSAEVLQILLAHAGIFFKCSAKDARRLWSAASLRPALNVSERGVALDLVRQLLRDEAGTPIPPVDPMEDVSDDDGPESHGLSSVEVKDDLPDPSPHNSQFPSSSSSSSQPGRRSRHTDYDTQQQILESAIQDGRILTESELGKFSARQRDTYDHYLSAQRRALKSLGKRRKSSRAAESSAVGSMSMTASVSPVTSSSSDVPRSVHWRSSIPSSNLSQPLPSTPSRRSRRPRVGSKRKPTSSMDEDSSPRSSRSRKDAPLSASDASTSESSDSSSESDLSESSSSGSLSSSSSSSRSSSGASPRHHHSHSSRAKKRSRRHRSSRQPDSTSPGMRRFLMDMGIPTYKRRITPEVLASMNGQAPQQWWQNLVGPHTSADSRSVHEGTVLAMCLSAGNNVRYLRELICRRLLGLRLVVTANGNNTTEAWRGASALLPLNAMSSVSLPVQQLIEHQARRSRHSSSHYTNRRGAYPQRYQPFRGRGGSRGRQFHSNRGGYHSGAEHSDNRTSHQSSSGRGTRGRGNSHSGASSASSQRGSSAGGSGATQQ